MRYLILAMCSLFLFVGLAQAKDEDYEVVIVWAPEKPIKTGSTTIGGVVVSINRAGDVVSAKVGLVDSDLSAADRAKMNKCKDLIEQLAEGLTLQKISTSNETLKKRHLAVKDLQTQFEEAGCSEFFGGTFAQPIVDTIASKLPG